MLPLLPMLAPFAAALCFALAVLGAREARTPGVHAAAELLPVVDTTRTPFAVRLIDGLGAAPGRALVRAQSRRGRARLDRRLQRAGRPEELTTRGFLLRKAGYATVGGGALLVLALFGQPLVGALVCAVCAVWMDLWLRTVGRRRQREIGRRLPDFLDVLSVTVGAGLGLQRALERVCETDSGPLGQEIRRTLDDMRLGLARRAALEGLRDRNDVPALGSFVTAMLQAEELGTPLAQALTDIADEVRRQSAQQIRQAAAKAGPKVSLVVSMTIVPGAMLLIVAAMVLANLPRFRGILGV